MGRKITLTGKNGQYIEYRGKNALPDNDREIRLEGDGSVYREYANEKETTGTPASNIVVQGDYVLNKHQETKNTLNAVNIALTPVRQSILDQLQNFADKGDWTNGIAAEHVKQMLQTVLGQGEASLSAKEAELSEVLWHLLENGRGDRVTIVWQNLVGYFDDRHLFKIKSSPALNMDFFGNKTGADNINKGRPSRGNMPTGFNDIIPLLDAYVPKVG